MSKASSINEHFINIANKLVAEIEDEDDVDLIEITPYPPVFDFTEISLYDTAVLIRDLKPSSSCGGDGLTSQLIKSAGPSLIPVSCYIINRSIASSCMPSRLKTGCVTPLFKEGNPSDPCNYRLISVLPVLGKIIEHIIHNQLYSIYRD